MPISKKAFVLLGLLFDLNFKMLPAAAEGHGSASADLQKMTAQYNGGQLEQALQIGQRILAREPGNLTAHYLMGNIYMRLGGAASATDEYNYCCEHGAGTQTANYAREALKSLGGASARPQAAPGGPSPAAATAREIARQAASGAGEHPAEPGKTEGYDSQSQTLQDQRLNDILADKRRTLDAQIQRLNEDEAAEIAAVAKPIHHSSRLDPYGSALQSYNDQVGAIRDTYAEKIRALELDYKNEKNKITGEYKR